MVSGSGSESSGAPMNLSQAKPARPAVIEASTIAIFEALMTPAWPAYARLVMKMDIVNPMPPSRPAPMT
jgi:hypothetical protein